MLKADLFASVQILMANPILQAGSEIKQQYFAYLRRCVNAAKMSKRKFVKAQMVFYAATLTGRDTTDVRLRQDGIEIIKPYWYTLPFDFASLLGFEKKLIEGQRVQEVLRGMIQDLSLSKEDVDVFWASFQAVQNADAAWHVLENASVYRDEPEYYQKIRENAAFLQQKPFGILVTATMSAGKSTFTNALVGKNVSLTQNMACTAKIHTIIGKPFEDGVISEYDGELVIDAGKNELLSDSENNTLDKLFVSSFLRGELGGKRIVLYDSPGVNSSLNESHMDISTKELKRKKYNLMVYLMNANHLSTHDEDAHLNFVAKHLGRTPIIFILNRVDDLILDEEDVDAVIQRQREYLAGKGFRNPIICPLSSWAGYLAKKGAIEQLSRLESRQLDVLLAKYEQAGLSKYYENAFPAVAVPDSEDELQQLQKECGLTYVEKIITYYYEGGKRNGAGLRKV